MVNYEEVLSMIEDRGRSRRLAKNIERLRAIEIEAENERIRRRKAILVAQNRAGRRINCPCNGCMMGRECRNEPSW